MAPPRTRRATPRCSSSSRSRRIVISDTSKTVARSAIATSPRSASSPRMAPLRPWVLMGGQTLHPSVNYSQVHVNRSRARSIDARPYSAPVGADRAGGSVRHGPTGGVGSAAGRGDLPEQSVALVADAGGEHQGRGAGEDAVAEPQTPEAVDVNRVAVDVVQVPLERARVRVVRVDGPIAEVAHEEVARERAKRGRSHRHPPRGVERPGLDETLQQHAAG